MYRTHTFDYITEALCFLNENNINKDNIITLTNGGVHWLLVWYEPETASDARKFYDIQILSNGDGIRENLRKTAEQFATDFEYDPPIINFYDSYIRCTFYNSPIRRDFHALYHFEDTTDVLSFYNYLVAVLNKRVKVRSDEDGKSKQPEDGAKAD